MVTGPCLSRQAHEGCETLCKALASPGPSDEHTCCVLLDTWLEHLDPNQELCNHKHSNDTHTFGIALSTCLHAALHEELLRFDLQAALDTHAARVCMHSEPLHTLSFQQTQETLLSLQIEFAKLYGQAADGAIVSDVDVQMVLLMLFAQLGAFLGHRWRESSESLQIVQGVLEVDEEGWCRVSPQSATAALDAVHAMLVASRLLAKAECVETADPPPSLIYNFHREASLDDFYDVSTAADCPVGAILQYKHRFRFLFHSVSQVVYFHYPSYQRRKQLALEELQATNAPHLHLLPLLAQVVADIPIVAEHSGLGLRSTHTRHPWAWAVLAQRVLLVDSDMRVFCARDLRTLLLHANPEAAHGDKQEQSSKVSCHKRARGPADP
jgi:hypothetical protein